MGINIDDKAHIQCLIRFWTKSRPKREPSNLESDRILKELFEDHIYPENTGENGNDTLENSDYNYDGDMNIPVEVQIKTDPDGDAMDYQNQMPMKMSSKKMNFMPKPESSRTTIGENMYSESPEGKVRRKKVHIREEQKIKILNYIKSEFQMLYPSGNRAGSNPGATGEWDKVYKLCLRYNLFYIKVVLFITKKVFIFP